jgi:DNA (cytosine-5)-methyltransferase 1
MTRHVAIDFFCGAGGMTRGLISSGFHVLGGVDNAPQCEKTYVQNKNRNGVRPEYICKDIFPKSKTHPNGQQGEIADRIDALIRDHKHRNGYRKVKLVFAICAPCQPFTKITKIKMSDGRKFKRSNDSNLLLTMCALIRRFRPDAIICENVEGIADGPDAVLGSFKRTLVRNGYRFEAKIVNAANFGVPQKRKRTIGIGFDARRHKVEFEVLEANPRLKRFVTVAETIGHLPPLAAGERYARIPNHRARGLNELNLKRISCAPAGGSNAYLRDTPWGDLSLECHRRLEAREGAASFTDTYTRMRGDEVSPTITTKCMSITNGRFGHYDVMQNRAITPHEAALLQTFPKRYTFFPEDHIEFASTLIGNAVPPRLAKFFGHYVINKLSK